MKEIPIAFLCSPYQAPCENEVRRNIRRAEAAAEQLWTAGFFVVCPHTNSGFMGGLVSEDQFRAAYRAILRKCADLVVLLSGWEDAGGCVGEVAEAREHKIPVVVGVTDAVIWLNEQCAQ